jgi:hypothetical protein
MKLANLLPTVLKLIKKMKQTKISFQGLGTGANFKGIDGRAYRHVGMDAKVPASQRDSTFLLRFLYFVGNCIGFGLGCFRCYYVFTQDWRV